MELQGYFWCTKQHGLYKLRKMFVNPAGRALIAKCDIESLNICRIPTMTEFSQDFVSAMIDLAQVNGIKSPWVMEFMAFLRTSWCWYKTEKNLRRIVCFLAGCLVLNLGQE